MFLAFNDDNTNGSFQLCHLVYMLNVTVMSDFIHIIVCLYTTATCTDGAFMDMYL